MRARYLCFKVSVYEARSINAFASVATLRVFFFFFDLTTSFKFKFLMKDWVPCHLQLKKKRTHKLLVPLMEKWIAHWSRSYRCVELWPRELWWDKALSKMIKRWIIQVHWRTRWFFWSHSCSLAISVSACRSWLVDRWSKQVTLPLHQRGSSAGTLILIVPCSFIE